jgi:hypothetical protein
VEKEKEETRGRNIQQREGRGEYMKVNVGH